MSPPGFVPGRDDQGLASLFGYANGAKVVVVTELGIELPLHRSEGWTVEALAGLIAEIEGLPEVAR